MRIKEEIEKAVKESKNYSDVCRYFGIAPKGGNFQIIKREIDLYGIDTSHFITTAWNKGLRYKASKIRSIDELLVEGSRIGSNALKKRLFNAKLKEYKCERCGRTEWEGVPIPLELHHKNGDHYDNRFDNLEILCPNCHALSDNYRGSNQTRYNILEPKTQFLTDEEYQQHLKEKKESRRKNDYESHPRVEKEKVKKICPVCGKEFETKHDGQKYCSYKCANKGKGVKPSKEQLLKDIEELGMNQTAIGKKYNVSANAVKKWLKSYDLYEENVYINNVKKHVLQYDLNMNLIKEFDSISDAIKETNAQVSDVLHGRKKSSGGYIWKYAE